MQKEEKKPDTLLGFFFDAGVHNQDIDNEAASVGIVLQTCVSAMEQGLVHVDAINSDGWTLGYMFPENSSAFDKCLWDRY